MHLSDAELQEAITASGIVSDAEFEAARKEAARTGLGLLEALIGAGTITEEYARDYIAAYLEVPTINLEKVDIDQKALELVPESFAKSRQMLLFAYDEKQRVAKAGMLDPLDLATVEFLRAKLDAWIDVYMISPKSFRYGLNQYNRRIGEDFNKTIQDNIKKTLGEAGAVDALHLAESLPTVTILDSIIEHAIALNASDIHFEPFEKTLLVRYRIDGIVREIVRMPMEIGPIIVARIKVISGLQIDVHNAPQDGRFRFTFENTYVDVRVSTLPSFYGEKAEMRILQGGARPQSLGDLGLDDQDLAAVQNAILKPHGMLLVTGPTGSGKTTTLYSILHILNRPEVSINTIEDPIENNIPGETQTHVNEKAGVTFAGGLRALVRQNPNIIMIGEIRDGETADIAVNAALTGHLVLSTLHTNDAPTAIPRLIDMGVQPFLIASTLDVAIAQRLVRKICSVCVQSFPADAMVKQQVQNQARLLGISRPRTPSLLFRGKGCKVCNHSGYRGQIGIYEVLIAGQKIRELILQRASTDAIKKQAIKDGMTLMFEDGLKKVERGLTTLEEVLRVTKE
ncbi:type II/IV secretion system protein [Candidatus Uhrbacteria bacterium]|nr:type II/IV secretion system protein [Candidatus Uhrbacteria bacterium]